MDTEADGIAAWINIHVLVWITSMTSPDVVVVETRRTSRTRVLDECVLARGWAQLLSAHRSISYEARDDVEPACSRCGHQARQQGPPPRRKVVARRGFLSTTYALMHSWLIYAYGRENMLLDK